MFSLPTPCLAPCERGRTLTRAAEVETVVVGVEKLQFEPGRGGLVLLLGVGNFVLLVVADGGTVAGRVLVPDGLDGLLGEGLTSLLRVHEACLSQNFLLLFCGEGIIKGFLSYLVPLAKVGKGGCNLVDGCSDGSTSSGGEDGDSDSGGHFVG